MTQRRNTEKYYTGNKPMKLFKYYKKAVIYPSLFILFFSIVYSLMDNYKNDPLTVQSVIQMSILPSLIFSLLICGLSLTIFLNKFRKLYKNVIWNILTWFFLPFAYISIIWIHDIEYRIKYSFGFGNDFLYLLIMTIPYVVSLSLTFIMYRKEVSTAKVRNNKIQAAHV